MHPLVEPSLIGKTHIAPFISDDHMIQHADAKQLAPLNEPLSEYSVLLAWRGFA